MSLASILAEQKKLLVPDPSLIKEISAQVKTFSGLLVKELRAANIKATVFLGGSFAKGTLLKKEIQDVDLFVRFSKEKNISDVLEKIIARTVKKVNKRYERVHGSRDYFKVDYGSFYFEIVPVRAITHPKKAENVTDLSYFHVGYVKRAAKRLENEVRLAKAFFQAQEVYGAESYIGGFSGYGVECLIIHYKTFAAMIKAFCKADKQLIIDIKRFYKNSSDMYVELNESKRKGPIVLIDPTFKERNVLAALTQETFDKTKKAAEQFLRVPSARFFERSALSVEQLASKARKKKAELFLVKLSTSKPAGDVAGTKMKKFALFLEQTLQKKCDAELCSFVYSGAHTADAYLLGKSKETRIQTGPPAHFEDYVKQFKKQHSNAYVKKGRWYAPLKKVEPVEVLSEIVKNSYVLKQMDISNASIVRI